MTRRHFFAALAALAAGASAPARERYSVPTDNLSLTGGRVVDMTGWRVIIDPVSINHKDQRAGR